MEWTYGLFVVMFLMIYLFASLKLEQFRVASAYLEDALAASNLASAIVDIEEFGISHEIIISDIFGAYEKYREAIKGNLNLHDDWSSVDGSVISGKVQVVNYTVYNVENGMVDIHFFDEGGRLTESRKRLGEVKAPNGIQIESTSVYSEIMVMVESFAGDYVRAHKGNLVDVVK